MDPRLNEGILRLVVAKDFGIDDLEDVSLFSVQISDGAGVGEGIVTDVKRITIPSAMVERAVMVNMTYIAKLIPQDDIRNCFLTDSNLVKSEIFFYEELAGELQKIRKDHRLGRLPFAKCYYADAESGTLILEDLRSKKLAVPTATDCGMPDDYIEKILVDLAKFHATTYHYVNGVHGGPENLLQKHPILRTKSFFDYVNNDGVKMCLERAVAADLMAKAKYMVDKKPELSKKLFDEVPRFMEKYLASATPRKDCKFLTIIHGDFWYNNVMVKFDKDGKIQDNVTIDWQVVMLSSVGRDIQTFIWSASRAESRAKKWHRWLKLYHDQLIRDLVRFGYDEDTVYPFEEFVQDVNHSAYQGFLIGHLAELKLLFHPEYFRGKSFVEIGAMLTQAADQKVVVSPSDDCMKRTMKFVEEAVEMNII